MQKPYANPCAHILRIWCGICNGFVERLVMRPWRVSLLRWPEIIEVVLMIVAKILLFVNASTRLPLMLDIISTIIFTYCNQLD